MAPVAQSARGDRYHPLVVSLLLPVRATRSALFLPSREAGVKPRAPPLAERRQTTPCLIRPLLLRPREAIVATAGIQFRSRHLLFGLAGAEGVTSGLRVTVTAAIIFFVANSTLSLTGTHHILQHPYYSRPWPTRRRTPTRTAACSTSSSRSRASRRPRSRSAMTSTTTTAAAPGSPRPWRMRRWAAAAAVVVATTTTRIPCRRPRSGLGRRSTRKLLRGGVSRVESAADRATSLLVMNC